LTPVLVNGRPVSAAAETAFTKASPSSAPLVRRAAKAAVTSRKAPVGLRKRVHSLRLAPSFDLTTAPCTTAFGAKSTSSALQRRYRSHARVRSGEKKTANLFSNLF
jgi:hypothetical protein